ncbi:hypothetical protein JVT61DRAFT_10596 [Boletus reticuloceps]|uniref:Uncharacterized protein n=1 Tax=Boletus reticuloceps TaxID=495285 RepID=A0A8I2YFL9_9AGAM|nr:hypothetical protein JVT61DRAFT_10596 [Boletus reticuloceps]
MERNICPGCNITFSSPHAFLHHLNTDETRCISVLQDSFKIPAPPAFIRSTRETNVTGQYHSKSGFVFGKGETLLDRLRQNEHERRHEIQIHYPFADEGEWSLAKFLALNMTKTQVARYLKLPWFKTRPKPSFGNSDKLFGWLASLPQGPQWHSTKVDMKGFDTVEDIRLIWRNGLEVARDLFSNPVFANHMTYDPHIVMRGTEREYSDFFTGTRAHQIQVSGRA